MKERIAILFLSLFLLFSMLAPSEAQAADADNASGECIEVVSLSRYSSLDIMKRISLTFEGLDFYDNGCEYTFCRLGQAIENCSYLSLPISIQLDDPGYDASHVTWLMLAREKDTGIWYVGSDYYYEDGVSHEASWSGKEPHTIDAFAVIPDQYVTDIPGFAIGIQITSTSLGFPDQASARAFTESMERISEQRSWEKTFGDDGFPDRQKNGVVHLYTLHYDSSGALESWKGGTGFVVGAPGAPATYVVTALDNVFSADMEENSKDYLTIILADNSVYTVKNTQVMFLYNDPARSIAILELDQRIPGREPLVFCTAESVSAEDEIFCYGYDTSEADGLPGFESFTREELLIRGTVITEKAPDDDLGLLTAAITFPEDAEGAPVFNAEGYLIGMCTSGNTGSTSMILAGDAILKALSHLGIPYGVVFEG